jgi:hypothetical protein
MSEEIGLQFVRAIAENNFELLQKLFTDEIIFTVATPAKTWHAIGRLETEKVLREFFAPEEKISEVVSVNHYLLPGRSRISYICRGNKKIFGPFEYEHQAYYQIDEDKISHFRILCSGLYKP